MNDLLRTIDRLLETPIEGCSCGRSHAPRTGRVVIGAGVIDQLADLVRLELPAGSRLLVIADPQTEAAAGRRVADRLQAGRFAVDEALLPAEPHADDRTVLALIPRVTIPDAVVAVGSGTISDLGKAVACELHKPLITVGTAASMNGYSSPIVALTVRGLKRTLPSQPPRLLVLDSDVLSAAPPRMTRAGFGDLCSKPVSGADWTLSHWLGFDPICPTAMALADDAVAAARAKAGAIGCSEAEAVSTLGAALVLSGFAMDLAGMSSPASGGEHLISHYLDISADGWGRKPWLHGEQVAVGTALSLALYERIRSCGAPDRSTAPLDEDDEPTLRACHSHLDPEALSELIGQAQRKRARQPDRAARRSRYASEWPALWNRLDTQLGSAAGLIADLRAAGVPTRFDQIDVPLDRARHVARTARHMRDRYTVLDWAADLGLALDEGIA